MNFDDREEEGVSTPLRRKPSREKLSIPPSLYNPRSEAEHFTSHVPLDLDSSHTVTDATSPSDATSTHNVVPLYSVPSSSEGRNLSFAPASPPSPSASTLS